MCYDDLVIFFLPFLMCCMFVSMQMIKWAKNDVSNIAGEIALLSGLAMWVTTIPRIRRKMFELFFYTHYLYILFMVFYIFHVGVSYAGLMLPGFFLFVVDRYLRFLQSGKRARLVSARVLPGESFELNFAKSPGTYLYLITSLSTVYVLMIN